MKTKNVVLLSDSAVEAIDLDAMPENNRTQMLLAVLQWMIGQVNAGKYLPLPVFELQNQLRPFVAFELVTVCQVSGIEYVKLQRRSSTDPQPEFRNRLGLTGTAPLGRKSMSEIMRILGGQGESGTPVTFADVKPLGTVYGPNKPRGAWTGIVLLHDLGRLDTLPKIPEGVRTEWWTLDSACATNQMLLSAQQILKRVANFLITGKLFVFDYDDSTTETIL